MPIRQRRPGSGSPKATTSPPALPIAAGISASLSFSRACSAIQPLARPVGSTPPGNLHGSNQPLDSSRATAQRRLIDELLAFFGGSSQPVMAHLIDSGNLTLEDVKEAERTLRRLAKEKA